MNISLAFETICVGVVFDAATFISLVSRGAIVDARAGGLVIGRSHAEGNIYFVQFDGNQSFSITGSLEGGEYVLSRKAYEANPARIEEINRFCGRTGDVSLHGAFTPTTRVLNTHGEPFDKLLWMDLEQFVVNVGATAAHLEELAALNALPEHTPHIDLLELFNIPAPPWVYR